MIIVAIGSNLYLENMYPYHTAFPRNYVVGGSETGNLTPGDVSRERDFSHKGYAKMGRVVADDVL